MATQEEKMPFLNLLLSQPRTCSHLLTRILNLPAQPTVHKHPGDGYFFMDILGARFAKAMREQGMTFPTSPGEMQDYYSVLQRCVDRMATWVAEVESTGKGCFVKQHICWMIDPAAETAFVESLDPGVAGEKFEFGGHRDALMCNGPSNGQEVGSSEGLRSSGNETVLPDALLRKFKPTVLIRHPALAFPSLVRASVKVFESPDGNNWGSTFRWSRSTYEWYSKSLSEEERMSGIEGVQFPIVVDADDVNSPELVRKYARAVGMDEELLQWTWPVATQEEIARQPKAVACFVDTLSRSQGVIKTKSGEGIDLALEKDAWVREFGEKVGGHLSVLVDEAMPDYEWLKERRLRI